MKIANHIWLAESLSYSSKKAAQIAQKFESIDQFKQNLEFNAEMFKLNENQLKKLKQNKPEKYVEIIENCEKKHIKIVCYQDEEYPSKLKKLDNPPVVLYYVGDLKIANSKSVGIVGARKASQYGMAVAKKLAADLVENELIVVSGCAEGIDMNSHLGAIEGNGKTISVLGTAIELDYPQGCNKLKRKIRKRI